MAITIGSNITALRAQRHLNANADATTAVYERLASGARINRAGDDAAGLSIASSLHADSRVFTQAIRNVSDAVSFLNIAENTVQQLSGITTRLKELATQSANGVYSNRQRTAMQTEADALTAEYSRVIAVAQFNGRPVFDTASSQISFQTGYDSLQLSVGDELARTLGTGHFQDPVIYGNGTQPLVEFIATDVNRDGKADLVNMDSSGAGVLNVWIGNGDGSFLARRTYTATSSPRSLVLADVNNDGISDAIASSNSTDKVAVLLGNADGSFRARMSFDTAVSPGQVVSADFNGDGRHDIAVAASNEINVFYGNGDGSFAAAVTYTAVTGNGLAVGDFNGDGIADLASTASVPLTYLHVLLGNADGSFKARVTYTTGGTIQRLFAIDLNRDEILDLVDNDSGAISVLIGNGDGTFRARASYTMSAGVGDMRLDDINGDGYTDIAVSGTANTAVLFGNGDGTYRAEISAAVGAARLALGDVNGDGAPDMIARNPANAFQVGVFLAQTTRTFALPFIGISNKTEARSSLEVLTEAASRITLELGVIGSNLQRLEVASKNLSSARVQYNAAESRIMDADVASEAAELVRRNILQQAGAAVLSRANLEPELALVLLR